jgi:hypothetical protein
MTDDAQHVKLLAIFHYVVGALTALIFCFPLIHVAIGIAILSGALEDAGSGTPPPKFLGWIFVIMPATMILMGWTLSVCILVAGRKLSQRRSWLYCFVIGCIECALMPFGTILGVFTIIVLLRESVKEMFGAASAPAAQEPYGPPPGAPPGTYGG